MVAYGWAAGLTLWMVAGFVLAIIHGAIVHNRESQIPHDDTTGDTMDNEAFKDDVQDILGNGFETDSYGSSTDDGLYVAIGTTADNELFGYEENNYGQRYCHRFETDVQQRMWFDAVSASIGETEQDW